MPNSRDLILSSLDIMRFFHSGDCSMWASNWFTRCPQMTQVAKSFSRVLLIHFKSLSVRASKAILLSLSGLNSVIEDKPDTSLLCINKPLAHIVHLVSLLQEAQKNLEFIIALSDGQGYLGLE